MTDLDLIKDKANKFDELINGKLNIDDTILKVQDHLSETDLKFWESDIVTVFYNGIRQTLDDNITNSMLAEVEYGVLVDKEKLNKWIRFCALLDELPMDIIINIATQNKIQKLIHENAELRKENDYLEDELREANERYCKSIGVYR